MAPTLLLVTMLLFRIQGGISTLATKATSESKPRRHMGYALAEEEEVQQGVDEETSVLDVSTPAPVAPEKEQMAVQELEEEVARTPRKTSLVVNSGGSQHLSHRHQRQHRREQHRKPVPTHRPRHHSTVQEAEPHTGAFAADAAKEQEEGDNVRPLYSKLQKVLQESAKDIHELGKRRRGLEAAFKERVKQLKSQKLTAGSGIDTFKDPVAASSDAILISLPASTTFTVAVLICSFATSFAIYWTSMPAGATFATLQPWLRWDIGLAVLFCIYSGLSISFKFLVSSMRTTYSPTFFVTLCSLAKLLISLVLFRIGDGSFQNLLELFQTHGKSLALYAAPAMLYTTSDVLTLLCLRRLDPVAVQLLSQLRNVAMSIFWQILFQKKLSFGQNVGVFIVCLGMFTKDLDHPFADPGLGMHSPRIEAYTLMALCLMCNSAAALWTEKLLKDLRLPINAQNISYCMSSSIFGIMVFFTHRRHYPNMPTLPPAAIPSERILYAAAVLVSSAFGIVVSHFLVRFGNVLRIVSASLTICVSMPLQWAVLGYDFAFSEISGIIICMLGIAVFSTYDVLISSHSEVKHRAAPVESEVCATVRGAAAHQEKGCKILLLQHGDVVKLAIPPLDVIQLCQDAISASSCEKVTESEDGGQLSAKSILMSDCATSYSGMELSLKSFQIIIDAKSEAPLAALDSTWISAMRIGATTVLSIRSLAVDQWHSVTFYGLGNTARATMLCLLASFKHAITVRLLRCEDDCVAFQQRFACASNVTWEKFETLASAAKGADVVIVGEDVPVTALTTDVLKPGVLVLATERLACEWVSSAPEAGVQDGAFLELKTRESLQKAWTGQSVRSNDSERIIAYGSDLTTLDTSIGIHAYQAALKAGVGLPTLMSFNSKLMI